jgi:hypothetical protein
MKNPDVDDVLSANVEFGNYRGCWKVGTTFFLLKKNSF